MKLAPGWKTCVVLMLFAVSSGRTVCAAPPLTTVEGTVYNGTGSPFSGIANVTCKSFRASDGSQIAAQNMNVNVTNGSLRVDLVPTTTALDPVTYFVSFTAEGQPQFTQYWAVPPSSVHVPVADVQVQPVAGTRLKADQLEFGTQASNRILASPDGNNGSPVFRALAPRDIPPLEQSAIVNLAADLAAKYGSGAEASLAGVTITPSRDAASGTFRRFAASQTSPVLGVQTEGSIWAGYFDALGRITVPGLTDGCASWSNGVLGSTGTECGKSAGAGGKAYTVQVNGPGGVLTGYDEILIDPTTKQLAVPSLKITGAGAGMVRLASGSEPMGQSGTGTVYSEPGDILSFKPGAGSRRQIAMLGGHLGGTQLDPTVIDFTLMDNGSLGSNALAFSKPNSSVTGTTASLLAKLGTDGQAVLATTADTGIPVWAVVGGAGSAGSAELAEAGHATCIVDGPGNLNQYLVISTTTNGRCRPVATPNTGDWVVGMLTSAPAAAGQAAQFKVLGFYWRRDMNLPSQAGFLYGNGAGGITANTSVLTASSTITESQLPVPTPTGKGAVTEVTCPAGQFVSKVAGVSTCTAVAYPATAGFLRGDGAGNLTSVSDVMTSATAVTAAQLPLPTTTNKGGVTEVTCPVGQFVSKVAGVSTCTAVAYPATAGFLRGDGAGNLTSVSDVMTSATAITPAQLPLPTTTNKGGVTEVTCPAGQFVSKVAGVSTCTAVAYPATAGFLRGDGAGNLTSVSDVMTSATAVTAAQLPLPTTTNKGGVTEVTCPAGQFINKVAGDSTCAAPAAAGGSGTVALKTPNWTAPPAAVSNDGNNGTVNACPSGACTATATGYSYMVPAGTLIAGKRYRITLTGALASPASSIPTVTIQLRAATSAGGISSGTILARTVGFLPAANQVQTGFTITFLTSGTAAASSSSPVYSNTQGGTFPSSSVAMGNYQAQPVNLNTSVDLYVGPALLFSAAANSVTVSFYDFFVEELI